MFKQKFPAIFIIFFLVNYSLESEGGESSGIETHYGSNNNNGNKFKSRLRLNPDQGWDLLPGPFSIRNHLSASL